MGVSTTHRNNLSMWILIYSFSDTYYVWAACDMGLKFPTFFTSIVHVHHNLTKTAYHVEHHINLVELLRSDKAVSITILVHFCYPTDWLFSDKTCWFNRFFGDSRNSVSGKSIWHHHRTR